MPCQGSRLALARRGPSNGPGLIHRPESPLHGGRGWNPLLQPELKQTQLKYRRSRCLKTQHFLESFERTGGTFLVMARSAETVAVICTESITVPRNNICWLGDSIVLAKLTLCPRQSKWLRRRVLCDVKTACDWARMSQS